MVFYHLDRRRERKRINPVRQLILWFSACLTLLPEEDRERAYLKKNEISHLYEEEKLKICETNRRRAEGSGMFWLCATTKRCNDVFWTVMLRSGHRGRRVAFAISQTDDGEPVWINSVA